MTAFPPKSTSRMPLGRTMLLAGTALGASLFVQAAPVMAAEECGAPVNGVVTCPAGEQTGGVAYVDVTDLTLTIPGTAPVSNTGAPAVLVTGSTGAVVVEAADVTGNGDGGQGVVVTTTTGSIAIDVDKAATNGTVYGPVLNDAVVAVSTSGDITVDAGEVSTAGPYTSGVTVVSETGDVVISVDKAVSTGVGGGIVSGQSVLFDGDQAVDGGSVSITAGEVTASQAAGPVQGVAYGDVTIVAGDIVSSGGPAQGGAGFTSFGLGLFGRSYAGNVEASVDSLSSSGLGNLGARLLANAGDASLDSGEVSVTGDNAYGIRVTASGAASINAGTTSTSGNAGADGAGTYFADAILIEGGESMTVVADQTSASGNGAGAIVAIGNGSISIDSNSAVATGDAATLNGVARFANAISAQSFAGDIDIVSGLASTEGDQSWAIYASAANGAITIESETATASGLGGRAIYANGGGGVTIVSGTASTTGGPSGGNPSDAIFALTFGQPSDISITSETATTAGNGARGIFAWTNEGDIAIDSGTIVTGGNQATGIMVDANGNIPFGSYRPASGGTGQLSIVSGDITTTGNNSWGIGVDHVGPISITSGSITTSGITGFGITVYGSDVITIDSGSVHSSGAAIIAWGDVGPVTIDSDDVVVGPNGDIGVFARTSTGDIVINAGRTETQLVGLLDGSYTGDAIGAYSQSGDITITSEEAIVVGEQAFGVYGISGAGAVDISSGSVSTAGVGGIGLYASGGQVTVSSDTVTTTGERAIGILASSAAGDIVIDSGSITTGGYLATGIMVDADGAIAGGAFRPAAGGTGAVTITSGTIVTTGNDAWGIGVDHIGPVDITSESITTSGLYAAGITVYGGDTITIDSGSVETQAGAGIIAWGDTGNVTIDSDHVVVGPGGDIGIFARTSTGDIVINAGYTESQLVGILGGQYTGDAVGAFSQSGDITITSEEAVVVGEQAFGLYAITGTGAVSITSGSVETAGLQGVGIFASGATVDIVSGSITTTGDFANGIQAEGGESMTVVADQTSASGNGAGAIVAIGNGSISIDSNSAVATGDAATLNGVARFANAISAQSFAGDIDIVSGLASTEGDQSWAIYASAANGAITIESETATASGLGGRAIYANGAGGVTIVSGTASTTGGPSGSNPSDAIFAQTFGQPSDISIASDTATTTGNGARGIFARTNGGDIAIDSGSIVTGGNQATGIYALGATVDIDSGTIVTTGDLANGIQADGSDGVTIVSESIVVSGANATGIRATSGAGDVTANSGDVSALGAGSGGVNLSAAGEAVLVVDGDVIGAESGAIIAADSISVTVESDGSVMSTNGAGLVLAASGPDGATLVTAGHIAGGPDAAAVEFSGASDDTVVVQAGATFDGAVLAGDGVDTLVLSGAGQTGAQAFGDMLGFEQTSVEAGAWALTGLLQTDQIDIAAGAELTIDGTDGALGEIETSGGDLAIVNDGRLVYASDDDDLYAPDYDVDISGAGEVELVSGAIVATGDWTFTGPTRVSGGELYVQNDIAGGLIQTGGVVVVSAELGVEDAGLGTLMVTGTGASGSFGGDIVVEGGQLYLARDGDLTLANEISGSGGEIIWAGAGSVAFNGVYDRSGLITNDSVGTVYFSQLGEASALTLGGGSFVLSPGDHVTGGLSGDADLNFVDASLTVDMTGDLTFAGDLTGDGDLTKAGDGILRLSGANSYTGQTSVLDGAIVLTGSLTGDVFVGSEGTFRLGRGGTEGDLTGDLEIAGLAIFDRADEYEYTGDISGDGQLLKLGDERLVLSGEYNFTGVTIVRGGSVRILQLPDTAVVSVDNGVLDLSGETQTIAGLSGGEDGEIDIEGGALTVDQSGSTTFAGSITGSGSFTLTGGGVLELSGNNTYTGDTNVEDGLLQINGSVASNVNIGPDGVLGGAGDIGGDVVVGSGGIVGPGNSPGTLTVAGDFTFATGSTYQVEVLGDGQHDQIVVGGATTIETGVQVEVLAGGSAGDYAHLSQYGILTSAGGITGQFAGVTSDMAFLTPYLVYSPNAVRLDLVRNDIRFNRFATTANQVEVADAAEAAGYGADVFDAVVVQNAAGAAQAYDALDGQIHADVFTSLAGGTGWLRSALTARQRTETDAAGGWGAVLSGRQALDGEAGAAGAETETSGLVAGGDALVGDIRLGAALSYSRDDLSVSDRDSAAEISNVRLAAYAGKAFGPVRLTLGGVYGWSTIETTRDVVFPGFAERVTAEYDARTVEVSAEISTRFEMNAATVEPFARATYFSVETDDTEEAGGVAGLTVAGQSRDLSTLELGVRFSGEVELSGDAVLQPRAGLAWRGNSGDLNGVTEGAFQGAANGFAVRGAGLDESALAVSFGTDLVSTGRFRFSLDVEGVYGDQSEAQSVRAGGSWRF